MSLVPESRIHQPLAIFLIILVIVSTFAYIPVAEASHNNPPPPDEVFNATDSVDVWERSVLPLRVDMSNSHTQINNSLWKLEDTNNNVDDLGKQTLGVFNPSDQITIDFDDLRANRDSFANEKVELIAAHIDANADVDDATSFSGALDLLNSSSNVNKNATFYSIGTKTLDSNGKGSFTFTPDTDGGGAGHYVFFLGTSETGKSGFQVNNNNDLSLDGNVTVVGVDVAAVQKKSSGASAQASINRGNNLTVSADVSNKINGQDVRHIVVLFDENTYKDASFKLTLENELTSDFNISENATLSHSIAEVNGVGRVENGIHALGVDLSDDQVAERVTLGTVVDFIAEEVTGPTPDTTATGSTILNASVTAFNGSASETINVETFKNWTTGQYRWVHIAVGKDSTEMVTDTNTVNIQKPVQLSISADDTSISEGSSVTFTVTRSDTRNTVDATISIPGEGATLSTGSDGQVSYTFDNSGSFTATASKSDTTTINFQDDSTSISVSSPSPAPSPANIQYSNLQVSPTTVNTSETVTISADISNTGGQSGSFNATLKINGTIKDFKTGSLGGGSSTTVQFTRSFNQAGTVSVTVDGLSSQTVTVNQPQANIQYSNLQVSPTTINTGEEVTISATVENTGSASGSFDASLNVNGNAVDSKSGSLAAGASQTITFNRTFTTAGTYNVTIEGLSAQTVTVEAPANADYSDLSLSDTSITTGESITVSATLSNTGTVESTFNATLVVDNQVVDSQDVTLAGGASTTVTFTRTFETAGEFEVTINGLATQTVTVNQPADISITDLTVVPQEIQPNGQVVATATLENQGDVSGEINVTFSVDGSAETTETVSVDAGTSENVTFTTTFQESGEHTISVDGFEQTVTVLTPATFEVDNLDVSPTTANITETIVITANVSNTGGVSGVFTVNLTVNGAVKDTRQGFLTGGTTREIRFIRSFSMPGNRTIGVEDLGPVTVQVEDPDVTPPTISLQSPSPGSVNYGTQIDLAIQDSRGLETVQYSRNTSPGTTTLEAPYRIDTTGWQEGPTAVTVTATDAAGNTLEKTFVFDFVSQPSIDSVAPRGTTVGTRQPTITVTYSDDQRAGDLGIDPAATRLFIDDREIVLDSANTTTNDASQLEAVVPASLNLEDGQHIAEVSVEDNAGHRVIRRWRFSIDTTPPTTSISAQPTAAGSTNRPITATIQARDQNLASAEFSVRNTATGNTLFTENITSVVQATTGSITLNWGATAQRLSGSAVDSGTYELVVQATDDSGTTSSATTTVTIDNEMPTLSFESVTPTTTSGSVSISATADGTNSDVSSVVFVASRVGTGTSERVDATLSGGTWSGEIDISGLPDGTYEIRAIITDQADNENEVVADTTVTLDTTAPELAAAINTNGEITVTSSEALPSPPSITLIAPNGDTQSVSLTASGDSNTEFTGSINLDQSGMYTIEAEATDAAGNSGSGSDTATVSREPTTNNELVVLNENTGIFLRIRTTTELEDTFVTLSESNVPFASLPSSLVGGHFIDGETAAALANQENVVNVTIGIPSDTSFFPPGVTSASSVAISFYDPGTDDWIAQPTRVDEVTLPDGTSGTYLLTTVDHLSTYGTTATDSQAPSVSLVKPNDGETFAAGTSTVETQFDISDDGSGIDIDATEVSFDGTTVTDSADTSITTDQITYTATDLSPGEHTVTVTVADQAGNTQQQSVSFTVEGDSSGPSITISQPESGTLSAGTTSVNLSASYSDPETGIDTDSVTVLLDGSDITGAVSPTSSGLDHEITGLNPGDHTITVQVENGAGIQSEARRTFSIGEDTTSPTVTFNNPTEGETISPDKSRVQLDVNYTDTGSGVDSTSIQVFADGIEVTDQATITASGASYTTSELLSNTTHRFTIRVADAKGFTQNASVNYSIAADTTPPTIDVTPANGTTLPSGTTSTEITIDYTDNGTAVDTDSLSVLFNGRTIGDNQLNVTADQASFTVSGLENETTYFTQITVLDNAGNTQQQTTSFSIAGPTDVAITEASLSATEITTAETLTVTATAENFGTQPGSLTAALTVDGTTVDQQTVTVAGRQTETLTFTRDFDETGTFTIAVNGVSAGTLVVTEAAPAGQTIEAAIAGTDGVIQTAELLNAIDFWRNNEAVPDTGGKTIDTAKLLDIVDLWRSGEQVTLSIEAAIAGDDGVISTAELLNAIDFWRNNEAVPDTGGKTIDTAKLLDIIDLWRSGEQVT